MREKEVIRKWKVNHIDINIHIHIHIHNINHQTIFILCISAIVLAIATIIDAVFELESRDFGLVLNVLKGRYWCYKSV